MTVDWWSTQPAASGEEEKPHPSTQIAPPWPTQPPVQPERDTAEGGVPETTGTGNSRSKAVKVVGGIAGAVIVGALLVGALSDGGEGERKPSASASSAPGIDLPPAGNGVPEADSSSTGQSPAQDSPEKVPSPEQSIAKGVTLTATPSGEGQVGAVIEVVIRNNTEQRVIVLATLVKGDGRPAVVGEGTLAPGLRTIEPGEVAEGTVEFSVSKPPLQVALMDLSGNLVAASDES